VLAIWSLLLFEKSWFELMFAELLLLLVSLFAPPVFELFVSVLSRLLLKDGVDVWLTLS
jgi:hypothetical protein